MFIAGVMHTLCAEFYFVRRKGGNNVKTESSFSKLNASLIVDAVGYGLLLVGSSHRLGKELD